MPIEPAIFLGCPCLLISPRLEISFAALWEIFAPCRFECSARGLKACRGAVSFIARIAARVKAANPLPRLGRVGDARSLQNHADAHAGIVDVPAFGAIIDAFASKGGQARLIASACTAVDEGVIGDGTLPLHLADVRSTPRAMGL
jgi:hypothetical protein